MKKDHRFSKSSKPTLNLDKKEKAQRPVPEDEEMRLNKYIAHCGICSRRQAADLVKEGLVQVNGKVVIEPWQVIKPTDKVFYKGQEIKPEVKKVYLLMNKPKNVITTASDDRGRKTVMDLIDTKISERVYPVGRLDRDTTGLLLLTNDGDLAKKLSHPSHNVQKVYQVTLDKPITKRDIDLISQGLELEDGLMEVDQIGYVKDKDKNEVIIEIHNGKNRVVRRIFEHLEYRVIKLDRIFFAGLTKKDLPRGFFRHLTDREIVMLKHFV